MSRYTFIVNPTAGKGRGGKLIEPLRKALDQRSVSYELLQTERRDHATQIAQRATGSVVVAVGGDGTVNEIVNGLVGTDRSLGIIPAGSGNDLSKSINLPTKLHEAISVLLIGKVRPIDVGKVSCYENTGLPLSAGNHHERYFVNGVGVGFDAAVAERTQRIKYLSGTALYIMAVFQTLGR